MSRAATSRAEVGLAALGLLAASCAAHSPREPSCPYRSFNAPHTARREWPGAAAPTSPTPPSQPVQGPGYRGEIVSAKENPFVLQQCSRGDLGPPDDYWLPNAAQIAELEAKLPAFVRRYGPCDRPDHWRRLAELFRSYSGVVRGSSRRIVVQLASDQMEVRGGICDGGPSLFGVEFDVEQKAFVHIDYNGEI